MDLYSKLDNIIKEESTPTIQYSAFQALKRMMSILVFLLPLGLRAIKKQINAPLVSIIFSYFFFWYFYYGNTRDYIV